MVLSLLALSLGRVSSLSHSDPKKKNRMFYILRYIRQGKSALDLAIQTARRHNCRIILANDPDADRMAVAEQNPDETWKVYTGMSVAKPR